MTNVCKPFRHAASLALAASVALGAPGILAAAAAQPALALTTADAESFWVALEDDATDTVILQGDIELAQPVAIGGDKAIYLAGQARRCRTSARNRAAARERPGACPRGRLAPNGRWRLAVRSRRRAGERNVARRRRPLVPA